MKISYSIPLMVPMAAMAADMSIKLDVPTLNVAEYKRPYIAVWLERPDQTVVTNLAVMYEIKRAEHAKYLKDLRTWWRKAGRDTALPADGLSGATRSPGEFTLAFPAAKATLDKLPAGDYVVMVEAAREHGGREVVKLPLQWPPKSAQSIPAKGKEELGNVSLLLKP